MKFEHLGMVGYGEVGRIFAAGLQGKVSDISAWDIKFDAPALREAQLAHAAQSGVDACMSMAELCARADLVISAVTASNTLAVAQAAAPHIRPGAIFLDLNSASPAPSSRPPR